MVKTGNIGVQPLHIPRTAWDLNEGNYMSQWTWLILAIAIVAGLIAAFILLRKRQRKSTILAASGRGTGEKS